MDKTQYMLQYRHVELTGERAVTFNRWVEIAAAQGATQTGYYDFDPKTKKVAGLDLTFTGPQGLITSLQVALLHAQGLPATLLQGT